MRRGGIEPPAPRRCWMATENFTTKPSAHYMEACEIFLILVPFSRLSTTRCFQNVAAANYKDMIRIKFELNAITPDFSFCYTL
ncbi:uncharacterized protein CTRU02_207496 [Colletotrichum truncatum]|uniref:Uncharacterized protein n=1 Tax=Colletotrichum truncatum TaxID=5467 RepID=A0ACC3Z100_COLTU